MKHEEWTHFEFTSGANPYIATAGWKRDEIIEGCRKRGYRMEELPATIGRVRTIVVHDAKED